MSDKFVNNDRTSLSNDGGKGVRFMGTVDLENAELKVVLPNGKPNFKKRKQVNIVNDFFAYDEPVEKIKKRKRKKASTVTRSNSNPTLSTGETTKDLSSSDSTPSPIEVRTPKPERTSSLLREVTPPPPEVTLALQNRDSQNTQPKLSDELDELDEGDILITRFNSTIRETIPLAPTSELRRSKPKLKGSKDIFKLTVNLERVNLDVSLELRVTGSAKVEKIVDGIVDKFSFELVDYRKDDLLLVFKKVKLPRLMKICAILELSKNIVRDSEGEYSEISLFLVPESEFDLWKTQESSNSVGTKRQEEKEEEEVEAEAEEGIEEEIQTIRNNNKDDDDAKKMSKLDIRELEKMASDMKKLENGIVEVVNNSFSVYLKSSEKNKMKCKINPQMKVSEIKQIFLNEFPEIKDCKLMFDDEEMDLDAFVKDTELEDDYLVDVIAI